MFLGLDVGGTHTDAVLLDSKGIISSYKTVTDHDNLFRSVMKALEEVTSGVQRERIERINLSTTLSTNAIVENTLEDVGVIVSAGPGIDPADNATGSYFTIDGSIDHRGTVIKKLDDAQLASAVKSAEKKKLRVFAAVTKFSTRNPDQENRVAAALAGKSDFVTLGHRVSGQLSFPRRVNTAYFNSAVWRINSSFVDSIEKALTSLGVKGSINILKADGGTMPMALSRELPVESILSGPAASIMGIISLCRITEDSIILDIGGTTTDLAVFAGGAPLVEREGIALRGRPTLVRSLKARSIGVGGDSFLAVKNGRVEVGPERRGPSMADGGSAATLIDAMNVAGAAAYGDADASGKGIAALAGKAGMKLGEFADAAVSAAVDSIHATVSAMLAEIVGMPVYTIHEMLEGREIVPRAIYLMGGPAAGFGKLLEKRFGLPVTVPGHYAIANAIGAAVARPTMEIELFADTSRGVLVVPSINVKREAPKDYRLEQAEEDAKKYLAAHMKEIGAAGGEKDMEITESSCFKMVQGYYSSGRDIRVKCQIKPGVIMNVREKNA